MQPFGLPDTDPAAARIREAAARGTLSHALLFTGPGDRLAAARLAAAALRSLPEEGGELKLCYTDNRGTALTAGWMAGE